MFHCIVLILFIPFAICTIPYGRISQAQLLIGQFNSFWLFNQSSWAQCMCQALRYRSPTIAAFNFFLSNQTCQLIPNNFSNTSVTFYIIPSSYSTLIFVTQDIIYKLTSICCSDIFWLMNNIQASASFTNITITKPVGLTLDNSLNKLIITYGNTRSIQQRDANVSMSGSKTLFSKTNAQPITYNAGFYFVGINPPAASSSNYYYVYNTSLTRILDLPFPQGDPQRAVWLYNNSLMCLIIQNDQNSSITFLNWNASSFTFTYNQTLLTPFAKPYGLAKSNDDTTIYVSGNTSVIYQLSMKTFLWSILVSDNNTTEIPLTLIVDSCGQRLWALMSGFGIRIYDRIYGTGLYAWNMTALFPTLYDMVLTHDYELYLIDYSLNELIHYGSPLKQQCTIDGIIKYT
ncbi:unnamed protein product [Adineta ricciae]|uniref:Uncharacterized protein n=1 Tax=Adineta ricciae TaxID=249248 RepID=A0A815FYS7_ADIRI|nr:unnamed protein product [Adineta ricciae]